MPHFLYILHSLHYLLEQNI